MAWFLFGSVVAALLVAVLGYGAGRLGPEAVPAFTTSYHYRVLDDPLELLIVQSDGQAFASLARDPLLRRPEVFRTAEEAAYRAQRPLFGWLAWAGAVGRSGWVPPAMAALSVLGTGAAVAAAAELLRDRGAPRWPALLVLLLPGTYAALSYLGPEPVALALGLWGLVLWEREPARWLPWTILLTLATLTRETLLVVPVALLLWSVAHRRRPWLPLLVPGGAIAAWWAVLHLRLGAVPTDAGDDRLTLPFAGLVESITSAGSDVVGLVVYGTLLAGLTVGAVVLARRDDALLWVLVLHVGLAAVLGPLVWDSWYYFGRVLLPAYVLGVVLVAGRVLGDEGRALTAARTAASATAGWSPPPRTHWLEPGTRAAAPAPPSG